MSFFSEPPVLLKTLRKSYLIKTWAFFIVFALVQQTRWIGVRPNSQLLTPSKLKCGFPIWKNPEEYWHLILKNFVFLKGFR